MLISKFLKMLKKAIQRLRVRPAGYAVGNRGLKIAPFAATCHEQHLTPRLYVAASSLNRLEVSKLLLTALKKPKCDILFVSKHSGPLSQI